MALTSVGYDGSIGENELPGWMRSARAAYGVLGVGDWRVETVSGQDRTVSVAAGTGFGRGVVDTTDASETIQLAIVASGSRWDTICRRRDFATNTTSLVAVQGSATKGVAAGRQVSTTGGVDDQPLALVQVTAGQQLPTAIERVRCWPGNGGMVAESIDALAYLDEPGAVVWVAGVQWVRTVAANGTTSWVQGGLVEVVGSALSGSGYAGQQVKRRIRGGNFVTDGNGDVILMPSADFSGVLTADLRSAGTQDLTAAFRILTGNLVARVWVAGVLQQSKNVSAVADVLYW